MSHAAHRSWVEISRPRIASNYQAVRAAVGPGISVAPVVKADAYRHGAIEVARVLEDEGAAWLAVSNVDEGIALRQARISARILVMADFLPWSRQALIEHRLTPVLHSLEDIAAWDGLAAQHECSLPYHLKIDTGMGRLGTSAPAAQLIGAIQSCRGGILEGLMTHFASVTDFDRTQTGEQIAAFQELRCGFERSGIRPTWFHLTSSGGIAYGRRDAWGNMVRPGHAIYGYVSPARGEAPVSLLTVRPALEWKASVLAVKDIPANTPVGYGAMYRAPKPMRIAILAVGYADGLPHRLSNRGKVLAGGKRVPILGAVSMDMTTIDATDCPELQPGSSVTLLGRDGAASIDAQEMARWAGTISYNVLCGIGSRVRRTYLDRE